MRWAEPFGDNATPDNSIGLWKGKHGFQMWAWTVCVCVSCLALPGQWRRQWRQSTNQLTVSQSTTLKVSRDCSSLISAPISLPLHFIQSVNWADGRQQQITNQMDKLWSVTLFIVYVYNNNILLTCRLSRLTDVCSFSLALASLFFWFGVTNSPSLPPYSTDVLRIDQFRANNGK